MKNLNYLFIIFLVTAMTIMSCNDVLKEEIVSGLTSEYLDTPEGFKDGVDAAYERLQLHYGQAHGRGCDLTVFATDEYTNGGHGAYHFMNQYLTDLNAEAPAFWSVWSDFYIAINTCNTVISRADKSGLPEDEKNAKLGEVHFLRAHYYFILVRLFGPIHLTLEESIGVETEANRTPEDIIYNAIIDDLEFAINHLPAKQDEFGRATKPAAEHMLALVLLTRGYRDFAENDDFNRAAELAVDVITSYNFELLDDVSAFYNPNDEQNAEILWSVQYSTDKLINLRGNYSQSPFTPWYEVYNDGVDRSVERGYGKPSPQYRPTNWLLENFRPLDVDSRWQKSMQSVWYYNTTRNIPEGASIGDTAIWITDKELMQEEVDAIKSRLPGVNLMSWNKNNIGESWSWSEDINLNIWPRPWKFEDHNREHKNDNWGTRDVYVYRLAETYLIAAEAMYMRNGNGDEAVKYINILRRRAAWPGKESEMEISSSDVDIDFILDERSRELFGEDKRWFDLKRTGKLVERVRKYNLEASPNIQDYHTLRPIPANQIIRTSNDYGQNPGY